MSCCLKYPGFCSGVKEGRREWEIDSQMDWCCFCRDADAVPFCHDEKKLSVKANLFIFPPSPVVNSSGQKNETADTSSRNVFPLKVVWAQRYRGVRSGCRDELLFLHIKGS